MTDEERPEQEAELVGPPRPPPEADVDDEPAPGPHLPPAKKRKTLDGEAVYLAALPSAEMYERSFMHRDTVSHVVVTPRTDFLITASCDGHLKFWKKAAEGVEFVKHFRSHAGPVADLAASHDGENVATCSSERTVKLFDVLSFDMTGMLRLAFTPRCLAWVYARGEQLLKLAVSDADSGAVNVFDARAAGGSSADAASPLASLSLHSAPLSCLRYSAPLGLCVSADTGGQLELWSPASMAAAAPPLVHFRYKVESDLYAHAAS